jgi:hypothetical protein
MTIRACEVTGKDGKDQNFSSVILAILDEIVTGHPLTLLSAS